MRALFDVVQRKLIKRGVSVKNLDIGEIKQAGGDTVRREVKLKTALDSDTAKKVAAAIKDAKLKKVQAAIQGDQVRVTSPSKDDLQQAIALLRKRTLASSSSSATTAEPPAYGGRAARGGTSRRCGMVRRRLRSASESSGFQKRHARSRSWTRRARRRPHRSSSVRDATQQLELLVRSRCLRRESMPR